MAFDSQELERRRQQRQQVQQQRQQEQQKLVKRLIIGFTMLVLAVIIGITIYINVSRKPPQPTQPSTTITTQPSSEPDTQPSSTPETQPSSDSTTQTEQTADSSTVIHLAAVGDLNITDAVVASGGDNYDFTNAFMDVAHILASADITTINLEGNLYGAPYGSATASAPQSMMDALARAGVDMVQLANSYSISQGLSGLSSTINGVRAAGMEPLGVYANASEFKQGKGFTIREVSGIKIAFVAFTKGMDGTALPAGSKSCVNLLYKDYDSTYQTVDTDGINQVLESVRRAKPDITVALLHWGSEFNNTISSSQEKICQLMLNGGVNAIIGTHSHYVQQMVLDPAKNTFVAYSLGDFFGDASRAGSEYSVILDLEITKDHQTGETRITNYSYTPIFTVAEKDSPLRIVRLKEAIASYEASQIDNFLPDTYEDMKYAMIRIEARTAGE